MLRRHLISFVVLGLFLLLAAGSTEGDGDGTASSSPRAVVTNSAWDGSVWQVERYLKRELLKDPDSYQSIEWSQVRKTEGGGYMVRHKFRARNSFGGYVVSSYGFVLDSNGTVVSAIPME
jgi:hypothetical protein